ncbi:MAG: ATP-binding protein [Monoglobales bacterium]
MKILMIEDDLSLINGLSFAVKKHGYELDIARTCLEADAIWSDGKYDLVILDVSLPDGSGFDICKKIRDTSKVPIIFLTAADEEGELNKLFHKINSLASTLNAHAENELKSKEFLKNTISDISHQLKTPLTALNIYNGILQDESENFPAIQEFAQLSEQELDRIETLVQNLLKITKLDAGTIVIDKKMENISEIMESVKRHFSFRAEKEGKKISLSGNRNLDLLCDRNWLTEAIDNIVKNALDHTEKGDCISIKWECFASVVQIIINDNGSGIHPEDLYHIFKRFYRSRYSKDTQGIGLGLPLAKAIIEAHNGTIEVNSELGRGTSFIINFLIPTKL